MTEWKEVKGFSDYEASSEGEIRNKETEQIVKPHKIRNGYLTLKLYKEHKPYTRMVHRLVAATFMGESDLEVNHIDGNKTNNRISNLEYVSRSENIKHAYAIGLIPAHAPKDKGTPSKQVKCLTNGKEYKSIREASKLTGVDKREIARVCNKQRHSAKGLVFVWN
jgi:hypothetical protein